MRKLVSLKFLEREPIKVHGHRGNAAVGLRPTRLAYERLPDIKPPHGTRGGDSLQHEWLVTNIAREIPGSMIETTLGGSGGKSIDVLWRAATENEHLIAIIRDHATNLNDEEVPLDYDELIAIEVETTAANVVSNSTKNLAHGVALNITAAMPEAVDAAARALRDQLTGDLLQRCLVVNVFELLESITEEPS